MNRHTVIAIVASIVIISPVAYAGLNIFALDRLELRSADPDRFSLFDMSSKKMIKVCNTSPFPANFDHLNVRIVYHEDKSATYSVLSQGVPASASRILNGTFHANSFPEAQYVFMYLDGISMDATESWLDPDQMYITTEINTTILGLIPYHLISNYTVRDFYDIMNEGDDVLSC